MIMIATSLATMMERPIVAALSMMEDENLQADLMAAIAEQRDRSAFVQLFEHFAPRIKAYMRRTYGFYRPHHIERCITLIFKAVGLKPRAWFSGMAAKLACRFVNFKTDHHISAVH